MGKLIDPIRYLDREEMLQIHNAAVEILDRVGMWIDCDEALDYLEDYGCQVDREARKVRFPPNVIESTVQRLRQANADPNRIPQRMSVRYSQIYFSTMPHRVHDDFSVNTGGFCVYIYDLE